jgi:CRISPR-associated protein Cmr2
MTNKTYIAITIGPMDKTFAEAKRTRAVWAASYFFSWFMRCVLEKANEEKLNIFLPYSEKIYKSTYGSGLYADRLYFLKDEATTVETIKTIIGKVGEDVITKINTTLTEDFLWNYLNLHIIEKEITEVELENRYPLQILNSHLDNKELHLNYNFNFDSNPLQEYFKEKVKDSFLAQDAFNSNQRQFKSITEIATTSLYRTGDKEKYKKAVQKDFNEDISLIDELINEKFEVNPHHKYFAVIYADGDNIGKMLQEINEKDLEIKDFSETLFEFGRKAEEIIYNYGGNGIYLGGEDVLCFAPAACMNIEKTTTATLFQLIKDLDIAFEETTLKYAKDKKLTEPSMSYGVMLSYYKNPLKEAMTTAHHLLDDKAKKVACKNSIAFRFQKHSGQYMECVIQKSKNCSTKAIYKIVELYCKSIENKNGGKDKKTEILSSIIQRFNDDVFVTLYLTATKNKNLDHFFSNYFNEDIHQQTEKAKFLTDVKEMSEKIIADYPLQEDCKNIIYTVLRYIHFINSEKEI